MNEIDKKIDEAICGNCRYHWQEEDRCCRDIHKVTRRAKSPVCYHYVEAMQPPQTEEKEEETIYLKPQGIFTRKEIEEKLKPLVKCKKYGWLDDQYILSDSIVETLKNFGLE